MATKKRATKKAAEPRDVGRPQVKIDHETLAQLCKLQCTEEELAAAFGCSERTIIRRLKEPALREIWERGKALGRVSIRRLQYRHAQMPNSGGVQMTIHLAKHHLGEHDRSLNINVGLDDLDAAIAGLERDLGVPGEAPEDT